MTVGLFLETEKSNSLKTNSALVCTTWFAVSKVKNSVPRYVSFCKILYRLAMFLYVLFLFV
jgi:hypothetical protein